MILRPVLLALLLSATPSMAQEAFDSHDPLDDNMQTGPAVGEKIPAFLAVDQNGQFQATIQSTDQDGDKVNGRIQIQETGS